jgi:hypothetical protein
MRISGPKRYAARRDERQSSERNAPNTSLLEMGDIKINSVTA